MAVARVSLSLDEELLDEARSRVGRTELSAYVQQALARQLQHDRLGELLAEMDEEAGPIPADLVQEAHEFWLGPAEPDGRARPA
jgi:Arc/MetJ family transcription regulator